MRLNDAFELAAHFTRGPGKLERRSFRLGTIGIAPDGRIYHAKNLPLIVSANYFRPIPQAHAEFKLCRAIPRGSIVYVVRLLANGEYAMARPCSSCMTALTRKAPKKIYYTIGSNEWGIIDGKELQN